MAPVELRHCSLSLGATQPPSHRLPRSAAAFGGRPITPVYYAANTVAVGRVREPQAVSHRPDWLAAVAQGEVRNHDSGTGSGQARKRLRRRTLQRMTDDQR